MSSRDNGGDEPIPGTIMVEIDPVQAMAAFDALPKPVREFVNYAALEWATTRVLEHWRAARRNGISTRSFVRRFSQLEAEILGRLQ